MDFQLKNKHISEANIEKMIRDILGVNDSNIDYSIASIKPIKEADFYGGFRVMLLAKLENLKQYVPIDVATGDVITPHPINYQYESVFDKNLISVNACPIETLVAEKLETVYSRGFLNSRSKDYFDLYLIWMMKSKELNKDIVKEALTNTFSYRNTELDFVKMKKLLTQLDNPIFLDRWEAYRKKNNFVGELSFQEVLKSILKLIEFLE